MPLSACILLDTLSLRPVVVFPASEGIESPLNSKSALSCATVRFGFAASSKAAAPATCGVAIEVPLNNEYVLLVVVLRMPRAGRPNVHRRQTKMGETGQRVIRVGRRHGDDVWHIVAARIVWHQIVVWLRRVRRITGSRNKQNP